MSPRHPGVQREEERRMTAAAERVTGKFHCSSSNHWATGACVIIRGRKVCKACADKRRSVMAGSRAGESNHG